jgi:hypothetical protein
MHKWVLQHDHAKEVKRLTMWARELEKENEVLRAIIEKTRGPFR